MVIPSPLLIGKEHVRADATFLVKSPYDGHTVGTVSLGNAAHLRRAVDAAHETFEKVTRHQAPYERAEILRRLADGIETQRAAFIQTIVAEAGKPAVLADAEVTRAIMTFSTAAALAQETPGHLLNLEAAASGAGHTGFVRRFPLGVIYGITPFNFPLNLVAHKVAPALATGNTIVIKPSPQTPLSAFLLAQLSKACGVPEGQINVVTCLNEDAATPFTDERVKMVSFTGSAKVGWQIKAACVRPRVTLELGGNAAAIVHDDAPLDQTIAMLATGAFAYAGQSCISTQRIFVHAPLYHRFRDRFVSYVRANVRAGDPQDRTVMVGPMINAAAVARVRGWIEAARDGGAAVLLGGGAIGNVLEPTVVEVPHADFDLCQEEAFAPVVTLHRYDEFDDALQAVNQSRYGLQAGVFTRDIGRAWRAFERLEVGSVLINQSPTFRTDNQPYGGVKDSGTGREGVRYAMEEMTEMKSLIVHVGRP